MNTIQSNSNYVVHKKLLSVHSEDRDITKWPNSNYFEITAPVEYKNVVSLRLIDIEIPPSYYVYSTMNQNIKLSFNVIPLHTLGSGMSVTTFDNYTYAVGMKLLQSPVFTITITEGTYTPDQMATELTTLMNNEVCKYMESTDFNHFTIEYNSINSKIIFKNNTDNFRLLFKLPEPYEHCLTPSYFDNYTNWGLGSYLGFNKKNYESINKILVPENVSDIYGDSYVYMELDYCNNIDEIAPYTEKSNALYNSKFGGKHNASFAKIPSFLPGHVLFSFKEIKLDNIFFNDPPLERIQKFKFKIRYHDGRMVDFQNSNYTFTIEITTLKPDTIKPAIKVNSSNYNL